MGLHRLLPGVFLFSSLLLSQKQEFDFYAGFREFAATQYSKNPSASSEQILEAYTAKLNSEGVPPAEIARRKRLLEAERPQLEADRWNRFYKDSGARYNHEPNAFLLQVVAGRRPGVALDYGMGAGRNALYLAGLGWDVYGFDLSDTAVAMAEKRAREAGLKLHAEAVSDKDYDFGKGRFDLILFSWTMPLIDAQKVVDSLKPGGTVVMECGADFVGRNGMLKMFDALKIVRYEIVRAVSDFYGRRETDVLRMIAVKP